MVKRILNKHNCKFTCPNLKGCFNINQTVSTFNDGNGDALTKQTSLSGNGICSVLTAAAQGTPVKCKLMLCSNWITGIELRKKINGIPLLNEDATMPCPVGGVISVQKPLKPIIALDFNTESVSVDMQNNKNSSEKIVKSDMQINQNSKNSELSDSVQSHTENNQQEKKSSEESKNNSVKYALCSYEHCENKDKCPYIIADNSINTDGAASKLRKNSKEKEEHYDALSADSMEKHQISWGNQAHHMISAKAAYCQYPELVKLGNYFKYDINCKENCCFLPAWEKGDGYGEKNSHYKKAQAYDVMKASGMQWHVGQHNYKINISEETLEKYPQLRRMDCYNDKINKKVMSFLNRCAKRFNGICIEKNYQKHKKWFIDNMNRFSEEIEEHLIIFDSSPKDSFPYYVSAEALRFAYELPRSGKVILISKKNNVWHFERFQYTDYIKDDDIKLISQSSMEYDTDNILQCIIFCENVRCFLIVDEDKKFKLPFKTNALCNYINNEDMTNLNMHFSAMFAEYAENEKNEYIAPKRMISKRLEECGLK